jgi:glycosyltransferase involved in cell wall biosynthesis
MRDVVAMSVIIAAGVPDSRLRRHVDELRKSVAADSTEIIVACEAPWADPPEGVRVVLVPRLASRGDKLDQASEDARGDLLVFLEASEQFRHGWQDRALEIMQDPTVGAAGGPAALAAGVKPSERAVRLILGSRFGSGPLRYRFREMASRNVSELPTTNLVVRRSAFLAVGGFQSPTPLGDDTRLCYKLRTLLGLRVVYDPALAVEAPAAGVRALTSVMFRWGRQRGDLTRRLPQVSKPIPYAVPAIALLCMFIALAVAPFTTLGRSVLLLTACAYLAAGILVMLRSRQFRTGVLAAAGIPMMHLAYGAGFLRGYVGSNLGEVCPPAQSRRGPRILICNWRDVTHPWAGGAEHYMHQIARRWARAGCEVGWLCQRYHGGKRVETIDGIRIHRVGGRFTLYPFAAIAYLFRLRNRYDAIVDCQNGIPFFTPLYTRKPVTLVVFHLHSDVFRRELPKWLSWFALWLENWLMPRAYSDGPVVTISGSSQADLEARGFARDRITRVVPGVDLPEATGATTPMSPSPLIVCLGRLKAYKSVDVLLRAMPEILRIHPDARIAIVGQGPERAKLEQLVWKLGLAASVRFHGYLEKQLRNRLLAKAWVSVCPSAFEGYGLVCVEANAWGVPVVAANVAGLRDSVRDGVTGVLVPHGDPRRLAGEINDLIDDPARREAMGRAGRSWAATHDWQRSAEAFLQAVGGHAPVPAAAEPAARLSALAG